MKTLKIETPEGYEIDKDKSTFENIVFKKVKNKLPTSVEEIKNRNFYIDSWAKIQYAFPCDHINHLSTKERAEAFLALMQLVELRDAWNGDWKADWTNVSQDKYVIVINKDEVYPEEYDFIKRVLHFKSRELRDKFLETFKDLIETAKELL